MTQFKLQPREFYFVIPFKKKGKTVLFSTAFPYKSD